jgi:hypothetical protein
MLSQDDLSAKIAIFDPTALQIKGQIGVERMLLMTVALVNLSKS